MTATQLENPALRRMLRPARPSISGSRVSEAKAWRSSLPRVTENKISIVASMIGFDGGKTDLETLLTEWDRFALSLLLKGPDEASGLVQIDDQLRTGLIEAQTIGRVMNTAVTNRRGTPLDASLCDHVVNAWMDGAAAALEMPNDWHTVRIVKDARAAKVSLDDGEYVTTEISILLGEGARSGVMRIVLPGGMVPTAQGRGSRSGGGKSGLLALEAEFRAVLHHAKVPLSWLKELEPGSILEIPRRAIDHVQLETLDGKRLTRARLGRKGEKRAVRILDEDAPDAAMPDALAGFAALPEPTELPGLPDLPEPEDAAPGLPDLPDLPPLTIED